ncbi:MAG: hypothetical protein JWP40_1805 [Blastococcus sp.]|nr:hypothetical protein [Blastococcus sp.]
MPGRHEERSSVTRTRRPLGNRRWSAGRSEAAKTVQPGATRVRRVVAEPHGPRQQIGLDTRRHRPSHPRRQGQRAVWALSRTGCRRAGIRRRRVGRHDCEESGVRGAVPTWVCRRTMTPPGRGRSRHRSGCLSRRQGNRASLRGATATTGGVVGRAFPHHGQAHRRRGIGIRGDVTQPDRAPGRRHLASPRRTGHLRRDAQVPLGQAQGAEIGPRGLLDTAEHDAHPDLTGAGVVMPPAEQLPGPPATALIDLHGLRLTREHGCTVFQGA